MLLNPGLRPLALCMLLAASASAHGGGSNYGVQPGRRELAGRISEWKVPTPKFARDPAIGPDGNVYVTVMFGNRIARFDTRTRSFTEWPLPEGAKPHGLVVAADGHVFYTGNGNGNGTIGELDPASGRVVEHRAPSGGDPHTIVLDAAGKLWFSVQGGGRIGRLERASGRITEYPMPGGPYGLALDARGYVWVCRMGADLLGRLDPASGRVDELATGEGTRPRRIAAAPDGMLWVTLYGSGELAKVDPRAMKLVRKYPLPAGPRGGPYAVTVDGAGRVWVNEIETDTVVLFDPAAQKVARVFALPTSGAGIRKAVVDAQGRYWYMGSHNGRLGVIE